MTTATSASALTSPPPLSHERLVIGTMLYYFAWTVEIFAVIIGLAISIMQGITSFSEIAAYRNNDLGFGDYTNVFIAMMPFFMVSIVELTKIPFVGAAYKTSHPTWKLVFGATLLFIAFITFESALNGFERNFHALIYTIDKQKKELVAVDEELVPLQERREKLANLTIERIESDYNQRHATISEERNAQASIIQGRIQDIRGSTQSEALNTLRDQIDDRRKQVDGLRADRQRELDALQKDASQMLQSSSDELELRRRTLQQQIAKEQDYLKTLRSKRDKEIEDAGMFSEDKVRKEQDAIVAAQTEKVETLRAQFDSLSVSDKQSALRQRSQQESDAINAKYQTRIEKLEAEIDAMSRKLNKSLGAKEQDVAAVVGAHSSELSRIQQKFAEQQAENSRQRDTELKNLAQNKELMAELDQQILDKSNLRIELRNQINTKVGDNQIYRMAQWWFGKESAADLDRKDVMIIAGIWFGSLAGLIAVTGILLAFASYVIRDPYIEDMGVRSKSSAPQRIRKFIDSLRRLVIYWRRVQRKPIIKEVEKEVVREVPVQKVVMVEKPVEIVRKEIVYVPLYTDDPTKLRTAYAGAGQTTEPQTGSKPHD